MSQSYEPQVPYRGYRIELQTVTALFLHGTGPGKRKNADLLRAGAFKSVARYWFRAVAGPLFADRPDGLERLRAVERRIFGGASANGASSTKGVAFDLWPAGDVKDSVTEYPLLPHKEGNRASYSQAIKPGTRFWLRIYPALPTVTDEDLKAAAASFLLAVYLGGFGQRSRRGSGSLLIESVALTAEQLWLGAPIGVVSSVSELAARYAESLPVLFRAIFEAALPDQSDSWPQLPSRLPQVARASWPMFAQVRGRADDRRSVHRAAIRVATQPSGDTQLSEQVAREEMMLGLRDFKNVAFGLPYFSPGQDDHPIKGRHASPLWIHLHRLENGWARALTLLACDTLAAGAKDRDAASMVKQLDKARLYALLDKVSGHQIL